MLGMIQQLIRLYRIFDYKTNQNRPCRNVKHSVSHRNLILICFKLGLFFSKMPEFHINGRFPYHNPSLENKAIGASYDTSSSLMATGRSHNPTTAISTTTNTLDSEYSVCGFVFFIICFCFALAIMVAIGIRLVGKRRIMKTQESQESNVSIQMEPLSPPNFMQNCN